MDKDKLIEKIISNPEELTEEEIKALSEDSGLKDIYKELCLYASAVNSRPEPTDDEIKEELLRFKKAQRFKRHFMHVSFRQIAAAASIIVLTGIAVGAGISMHRSHNAVKSEESGVMTGTETICTDDSIKSILKSTDEEDPQQYVVFENQTLETMLSQMGQHYGCKVEYMPGSNRMLRLYFRWDKRSTLEDVVEMLNTFDQIDISIANNILTVK